MTEEEQLTAPLELDEKILQLTQGQIIERLTAIRDARKALAEQDKKLVEEWRMHEAVLLHIADQQGIKRFSTDLGTATVTLEVLPNLTDMDALWMYIKENDAPHLLQRRVSASAYRELVDAGVEIPGITTYIQRKISLRKR